VNLRRWWSDILAGVERPPLFTCPELAAWRWGGADDTPGIVIDTPGRFDPATYARSIADPDARAERDAIQAEIDQGLGP
jgi:hypothetical protein